jgi:hypothetical protein
VSQQCPSGQLQVQRPLGTAGTRAAVQTVLYCPHLCADPSMCPGPTCACRFLTCLQGWKQKLTEAGYDAIVFEDPLDMLLQQVQAILISPTGQTQATQQECRPAAQHYGNKRSMRQPPGHGTLPGSGAITLSGCSLLQ